MKASLYSGELIDHWLVVVKLTLISLRVTPPPTLNCCSNGNKIASAYTEAETRKATIKLLR